MKPDFNKDKLQLCGYITLTAAAIYVVITILNHLGDIWGFAHGLISSILSLLTPVFIAIAISFLLWIPVHSLDERLKKIFKKKHRGISVVIVYFAIIALLIGFIILIYFMIGGKLSKTFSFHDIISFITKYFSQSKFDVNDIQDKLSALPITDAFKDTITSYISAIVNSLQDFLFNSITSLFSSVTSLVSNLFSMFICVVLSVYLLLDKEYFLNLWNKIFFLCFRNSRVGKYLKNAGHIFTFTFTNYIRGQLLEAFFVGVLSTIALSILHVDFAVVIGIIAGITNMIPYIGPLIGTVLAAIMALLSGDLLLILWVIIAMQIVQQIDNNLLAPRIVGKSVELHAVFTMIAITVGGNMGGLLGMLIAVPVFASAKKLLTIWYHSKDYERERLSAAEEANQSINNEEDAGPDEKSPS